MVVQLPPTEGVANLSAELVNKIFTTYQQPVGYIDLR